MVNGLFTTMWNEKRPWKNCFCPKKVTLCISGEFGMALSFRCSFRKTRRWIQTWPVKSNKKKTTSELVNRHGVVLHKKNTGPRFSDPVQLGRDVLLQLSYAPNQQLFYSLLGKQSNSLETCESHLNQFIIRKGDAELAFSLKTVIFYSGPIILICYFKWARRIVLLQTDTRTDRQTDRNLFI